MDGLIKFFESKSEALRPYLYWFIGLPLLICALLAFLIVSFRTEVGLPGWLFNLGFGLMPVVVWLWGMVMVVGVFNPRRKRSLIIIEYRNAVSLVLWFFVPFFGYFWLLVFPHLQ
jgi:hypothetical protein